MRNKTLMENGSYGKLFLNLCVPTVIIMLVMVIYNMADIFFIGQLGRADMVAALSMSTPIFSILSGLGTLLGSGGCTAMAIALGRGETGKIRRQSAFCFYGSIGIGIVFGLLGLVFLNPICRLFGADEATFQHMHGYLQIMVIGSPILLFNNVFMNLIRADGSARASMTVNLLGTLVNIVLDPILIRGLGMGVRGAALATVAGNAVSSAYLLIYIGKRADQFSLRGRDFTLRRDVSVNIMALGMPLATSTLLMSASSIVINKMMIGYGATAVAAQGVAGKAGMLIIMLIMGICMGLQPAISYNYGANRPQRVSYILKHTAIVTMLIGSVLTVVCLTFRDSILSAFINDPAVIESGRIMLLASVLVGPIYGLYQLMMIFLQSTGKASYATVVSLLDKGLIYIPVMVILNATFGLQGLIFAGFVTNVLSILCASILSLRWERQMRSASVTAGM